MEAMKRVLNVEDAQLTIIGAGKNAWRKACAKRARKLKMSEHVRLLDPVPHERIPPIIQSADICVAPLAPTERNKLQGCNPIKLFEYMACRKPIVASRLPIVCEPLRHEENALLFRSGDPRSLRNAIIRLIQSEALRERRAANAYAKVR